MKISTTNTFDPSQLKGDEYEAIQPLVEFLNAHVTQVVSALRGQLNLKDNLNGITITAVMKYDEWMTVQTPAFAVSGVIPLSCNGDILTGFGYRTNSQGQLQLRARFADTTDPKKPLRVTAYAFGV